MSPKKPKEPMIACPSCGVLNRIASPFCKDCGDRIYKNGAAPTQEMTGRERSPGKNALRSAINSLFFVVIVAAFALAFWPYTNLRVPVTKDPGQQVERYLALFATNMKNEEKVLPARFSQNNINAFIGKNNQIDNNKLLGVVLSGSGLELIANEPLGPLNLSTRLVLKPGEEAGSMMVSDFWVGHLPLPGFWAKPFVRSIAGRFDLELDADVWDQHTITKVQGGSVYVQAQP